MKSDGNKTTEFVGESQEMETNEEILSEWDIHSQFAVIGKARERILEAISMGRKVGQGEGRRAERERLTEKIESLRESFKDKYGEEDSIAIMGMLDYKKLFEKDAKKEGAK
jgi:hypothetical protein